MPPDAIGSAAAWLATAEYQCSRTELSLERDGHTWRKALPCRTWRCAYCARKLRHGVMSLAAAGSPNRMLTLTAAPLAEPDANKARALLHRAWRALRLTIARELARPSAERWKLGRRRGRLPPNVAPDGAVASTARPKLEALPYFAVVERHRSGRPHLHILLRCGYIPQRWVSEQMRRLAGSPICDIRKVSGTKQAAAYVAKYIGKAPARFGNSRAYWYSKTWAPASPRGEAPPIEQKHWFHTRQHRWAETIDEVHLFRPIIDVTEDGWFSLSRRAAPLGAFVVKNRFPPIWRSAKSSEIKPEPDT